MLKALLSHGAAYSAAGVLSRGVQIVLLPVYTRVLTPEEYGILDYLLVFAAVAHLVVTLEISQGVARQFADTKDSHQRRLYASSALWFTVAAYAVFAVAATVFSVPCAAFLLDSPERVTAFRAVVLATAAYGVHSLLLDLLRWQLKPAGYAIASAGYATLFAAVGVYLVVFQELGVAGVFYGQLAGAVAGVAISLFYSRGLYGPVFAAERCAEMLRYSLPLVVSSVAVIVNLYVDRIAIKALLGLSELGLYGVGARFASVITLVLFGFMSALTPLVFENYAKNSTPHELGRALRFFLSAILPVVILMGIYSRELLWLFAAGEYYDAAPVIPILAISMLFANAYIFAPGLFLARKTRFVAGINIATASLNAILNLALIPRFGIVGSALATTTAAVCAFGMYLFFSQRLYPVPHNWNRIAAGVLVSCIVAFSGPYAFADEHSLGELLLKSAVFIAATLFTVRVLLDKADAATILQSIRCRSTAPGK
jgi:O-antigen/teichoic acid export membrane protein